MKKKNRSFVKAVRENGSKKINKGSKARTTQKTKLASYTETIVAAIKECGFSKETESNILTMVGTDGFCKSLQPSDLVARADLGSHLNVDLQRSKLGTGSDRRLVRIEVFDDSCVSQIDAPKLHVKALRSRIKLLMTQCEVEAICSVRPFMISKAAEISQCGYGIRAIGYVGADFDSEAMLKTMRGKIFGTSAVPAPTIRFIDPKENLPKNIAWLLSLPTKPVELVTDENGVRRWSVSDSPLPARYAVRQVESLTAIPFADAIFAIGSDASSVLATVVKAVSSNHTGRLKEGLVNEKVYQTWITWGKGWSEVDGSTFLPFRTDVPIKAPRAPKPAKTLSDLHRERRSGKKPKSMVKNSHARSALRPKQSETRH